MNYGYVLQQNKYNYLKILLILISTIIDFANIWIIITAIIFRSANNIVTAILLVSLSIILKLLSMICVGEYIYKFNNNSFSIVYKNNLIKKNICNINSDNILGIMPLQNYVTQKNNTNLIIAYPKYCSYPKYVLILDNKAILVGLDEFMYCLLNKEYCTNKELK